MKRLYINILILAALSLPLSLHAQEKLNLSLDDCREMAAANSFEVKNAVLDRRSAEALKKEAFTEYFPNVGVVAGGYYAFDPLLNVELKDILGDSSGAQSLLSLAQGYGIPSSSSFLDYGYNASVTLRQPLYAGGRIVNGNRLASVNLKAADLKRAVAVRDNALEVEKKYWRVVALEEKKLTLEQAICTVDTLSGNVHEAVAAGLALDTDSLAVSIERNRLLSSMTELRSGIRLAKMDLFDAVGQKYSILQLAASEECPFIDDIVLSDRPSSEYGPDVFRVDEVQAAYGTAESGLLALNVDAAKLQKKMAMGEALPQVGVGVSYGYGRITGDSGRWNGLAFLSVKIPLTDWWKTSYKMTRLENDAQKAANEQSRYSELLVLQLRKLWEELSCAYEKVSVAESSVSLSSTKADRVYSQYEAGESTVSDVLAARTELRQAEDELTDARIAYMTALSEYCSRAAAVQE